ncbi:MAG TPA: cytochrome b/b6 domain-containing protein [Acetobacteraceae bacterium]|nr:cytochrome b/b6 domain-containing protein [Acetobacteraceae bacterium]
MSERVVPMRVWDAPTRLFHWAIAILVGLSWLTERSGWMALHFLSGYSIIALLLFRLAWGFVGSETARFSHFLKSPIAALRHLAHLHRQEPDTEIGHNAAGGWMVLVMLALLAVQVATGLCANDDGDTEGPLFKYVGKDWSDWLSHIHAVNFSLIKIAVALHITAILIYLGLKRHDLVRPMITGRKLVPDMLQPPMLVSPLRAAVLFAIAAGMVALLVSTVSG